MSKEYYRRRLVDLRASIASEREAKKRDNEYYARCIKSASSISSKASYRKQKISASASHANRIESLKNEIARTREYMRRA